jgi:hypothetical protein
MIPMLWSFTLPREDGTRILAYVLVLCYTYNLPVVTSSFPDLEGTQHRTHLQGGCYYDLCSVYTFSSDNTVRGRSTLRTKRVREGCVAHSYLHAELSYTA